MKEWLKSEEFGGLLLRGSIGESFQVLRDAIVAKHKELLAAERTSWIETALKENKKHTDELAAERERSGRLAEAIKKEQWATNQPGLLVNAVAEYERGDKEASKK